MASTGGKRSREHTPAGATLPAKRAKGSSDCPMQKSPWSARQQVLSLHTDTPPRTVEQCIPSIHPNAKKLFAEVKDAEQFRIAAKVFWLSYFAQARGESDENINALFDIVCGKKLATSLEYRRLWRDEHESIMSHFVNKFHLYFQQWLGSPAGVALKKDQATLRKKKTTIPPFEMGSLVEYVDLGKTAREGIRWGLREIWAIFEPLGNVAEVVTIKNRSIPEVHEGDIIVEKEEDLYENAPPWKWFQCDMRESHLKTGLKHPLWLELFTRVANGIMIQLVLLDGGMQIKGPNKTPYDLSAVRQLIERIPTGSQADGTVIPFPILDLSLADWTARFNGQPLQLSAHTPISEDDIAAASDSSFKHLQQMHADKGKDDLGEDVLDESAQKGYDHTLNSAATLEEKFADIGLDLYTFLQGDFNAALFCPPQPMDLPRWNAFLQKMAVSNIYSQIELTYARAYTIRMGMILLKENCEDHINKLGDQMKSLLQQHAAIKEAEAVLNRSYLSARSASLDATALQNTVSRGLQNPKIASHVQFRLQQQSQSPFQRPSTQQSPFQKPSTVSPAQLSLGRSNNSHPGNRGVTPTVASAHSPTTSTSTMAVPVLSEMPTDTWKAFHPDSDDDDEEAAGGLPTANDMEGAEDETGGKNDAEGE